MEHEFLLQELERLVAVHHDVLIKEADLRRVLAHIKNLERCLADALALRLDEDRSLAS